MNVRLLAFGVWLDVVGRGEGKHRLSHADMPAHLPFSVLFHVAAERSSSSPPWGGGGNIRWKEDTFPYDRLSPLFCSKKKTDPS